MTIELTTQRFAGKVALVTGAASGIGAATARRLFAEGAQLVLVDLDPAGLDAVREETKAQVVVGDAAEGATLEQAVALAKSAYGRLDVLVTAAGFETVGGAEHVDFEAWRKVLSINLDGALLASRAALPLLVILAGQTALTVAIARALVFRLMGRDREAAMMTAGFVGFGLGATSNALASMRELAARFGSAPRAFLIVPIVGAFLIDFTNALVTTLALNLLR